MSHDLTKPQGLARDLPKIAARVLQNTHCMPKGLKFKFELISQAYGAGAVKEDFELWCRENLEKRPRYPISEYMQVVDQRLGTSTAQPKADLADPRIAEITSQCYELTGKLPPKRGVAAVLIDFQLGEITAAFAEYAEGLGEDEIASGVRSFFSDGGAAAVILSRRKRK